MSEEVLADDQSHYEVSLTAGQAFLAFVLLLLSLAAAFAFGLLLGRGQLDERLGSRRQESAVVNEVPSATAKAAARSGEVAVKEDDFKATAAVVTEESPVPEPGSKIAPPHVTPAAAAAAAAPVTGAPAQTAPAPGATVASKPEPPVPYFAQLLSTADQKTAEALATKLIDGGFVSSYVERTITDKGTIFRVRTKFASEAEAKAAEPKLRAFSRDVWITK